MELQKVGDSTRFRLEMHIEEWSPKSKQSKESVSGERLVEA